MVVLSRYWKRSLALTAVPVFPLLQPIFQPTPEDVTISYLPLAHMFERVVQVSVLRALCVGKGASDLLVLHLFKSQYSPFSSESNTGMPLHPVLKSW